MRYVVWFLILSLCTAPVLAETKETWGIVTAEAATANFWQEADIVFWQTMPFAAIWCGLLDSQLSASFALGAAPHWEAILAISAIVSAANGYFYARKVEQNERAGHNL
jgi:hypothetical protein